MNARDDISATDVMCAIRDSLTAMPLAGPPDVETIMARGRDRRHRRLFSSMSGTLAAAAGVALAVSALTLAGHQANRQPAIRLAAWTVTKLADGNIFVTIRELTEAVHRQLSCQAPDP